ncbi:hypothetical protein SCHPADRAFT_854918 [Schizopora paradoxa]|uniref:cAMP-independent regulatory protein pac2 n=1 Tax=Schizopora paradoxa TaxID=27342 RepID=A0A0H2RQJ9_9AGAM|nr:hypothetical protein SCHPADRAFT_854918 [Schizopora paradoxa]
MQRPTCTDVRIRSTRDAHIIFHAVSLGILKAINRRLDPDERAQLRSGCVYAWEERGQHTEVTGLGIERFTEGRRWGPSRVRDEFLFYYEKSPPTHVREKENPMHVDPRRKEWDPLVKQTYSVWVDSPRGRRKWHLTAYFTQTTVDQLQTVDDIPILANLEVPPSKYISTRLGKPRRIDEHHQNDTVHDFFRSTSAPAHRTYAPFPLPYEVTPPSHPSHPSRAPRSPPPQVQYEYPAEARRNLADTSRHDADFSTAHQSQQRHSGDSLTLPPLHALSIPGAAGPSDRRYAGQPPSQQNPSHQGDIPAQYDSGNSQVQYGYPTNGYSSPVAPHPQQTPYYPPTPTSAQTPQYGSPAYPTTYYASDGAIREIPYAAPQVPSHPTQPAHCHASKYSVTPTTPVNQTYPDSYTSSYPHADTYSRPRQAPPYTFMPPTPVEGQNVVRQPLPASIESHSQDSAIGQTCFTGMPAAAPPDYSSPTYRVRPSVDIGSHAGSHPSPLSESREDWEDAARHSPSLSPRSSTSSIGKRLDLAPLRSLTRAHPYSKPRDKFDDKALMAFSGRRNSFE